MVKSISILFLLIVTIYYVFPHLPSDYVTPDKQLFMKNAGQWDQRVSYRTNVLGVHASFLQNGISFCSIKNSISLDAEAQNNKYRELLIWNMLFENTIGAENIRSSNFHESSVNYLFGSDPSGWIKNVPQYEQLTYENMYNNIDVRYSLINNQLKYDIIVKENGKVKDIKIKFDGIKKLEIDHSGKLVVETPWGIYKEDIPYTYQNINGKVNAVDAKYKLLSNNTFTFEISQYNPVYPLIIDPFTLQWSTYMGVTSNNALNFANAIAIGNDGSVYVGGVGDVGFPITPGLIIDSAYLTTAPFVVKLNSKGQGMYSTFLSPGGYVLAIEVLDNNEPIIVGTSDTGTPVPTSGYQDTVNGSSEGFILRLNIDGDSVVYGTYFGGTSSEDITALAVDANNDVYITGLTFSSGLNMASGGYKSTYTGQKDVFVAKFSEDLSTLINFTYLGGTKDEDPYEITIDTDGNIIVAGTTNSTDYDYTNNGGYDTTLNGTQSDIFVSKLSSNLDLLLASTLIGSGHIDRLRGMAVNSKNQIILGGGARNGDYPITTTAIQSVHGNPSVVFNGVLSILNEDLDSLVYSTFYGGTQSNLIHDVACNNRDEIYIIGSGALWKDPDYPTYQDTADITDAIFIAHFTSDGADYACGGFTYFGGNSFIDIANDMDILNNIDADTIVACGYTHSSNLQLTTGTYYANNPNGSLGTAYQPFLFKMNIGKPNIEKLIDSTISICNTDTIMLSILNDSLYDIFSWTPAYNISDTDSSIVSVYPNQDTTYQIIVQNACIADTAYYSIVIDKSLLLDVMSDTTITYNESIKIIVNTNEEADQYSWIPAENLDCDDCKEPIASPIVDTKYYLEAISMSGCLFTDSILISVVYENLHLFIPNAFSPNQDNINDFFELSGQGINKVSFAIYDRLGQKVFESGNLSLKWDGRYKEQALSEHVFVIRGDVEFVNGEVQAIKGNVTILE